MPSKIRPLSRPEIVTASSRRDSNASVRHLAGIADHYTARKMRANKNPVGVGETYGVRREETTVKIFTLPRGGGFTYRRSASTAEFGNYDFGSAVFKTARARSVISSQR